MRLLLLFFFYKNLIIKKGFFPKFDISTFSERCQTFGHVSNSFGAPHFGQMHLTEKNRYFIKMQFLYFPRSKKIASTDFPISDKSFLANFFQGRVFLSGELLGNLNNWFQFPESFSTSAQEVE